jgi:hypothetical protein
LPVVCTGAEAGDQTFASTRSYFRGDVVMKTSGKRLCRLSAAAATILLVTAGAGLAQSEGMPCSAFTHDASGGWRVLSPVMLDLGGRLYSPTVGTVFVAGSTQHGSEMSDALDRQCGNR